MVRRREEAEAANRDVERFAFHPRKRGLQFGQALRSPKPDKLSGDVEILERRPVEPCGRAQLPYGPLQGFDNIGGDRNSGEKPHQRATIVTQPAIFQQVVPLGREFYARSTVTVARELLGKVLIYGPVSARIVEVEAYLGGADLASHSAAGITPRTKVIFGPPGHAYVYLSYGLHECLNIVAELEGVAGCVLIRALEPLTGLEIMRARRPGVRHTRDLANGPGKLTRAMAITRADYGRDLTRGDLIVIAPPDDSPFEIETTARIGITKCADLPLRFLIHGNAFVSR